VASIYLDVLCDRHLASIKRLKAEASIYAVITDPVKSHDHVNRTLEVPLGHHISALLLFFKALIRSSYS